MRQHSSIRSFGYASSRSTPPLRKTHGSCPCSRTNCTRLITIASRWPTSSLSANSNVSLSKFLRKRRNLEFVSKPAQELAGFGAEEGPRKRKAFFVIAEPCHTSGLRSDFCLHVPDSILLAEPARAGGGVGDAVSVFVNNFGNDRVFVAGDFVSSTMQFLNWRLYQGKTYVY